MNIDILIHADLIRGHLLTLPGVTEKPCFGTPGFYVSNKLFARVKEDGKTLVVHTAEREKWMAMKPRTFFITDHYKNYSYMLINLGNVTPTDLKELLIRAWHNRAPKRLRGEFDKKRIG